MKPSNPLTTEVHFIFPKTQNTKKNFIISAKKRRCYETKVPQQTTLPHHTAETLPHRNKPKSPWWSNYLTNKPR